MGERKKRFIWLKSRNREADKLPIFVLRMPVLEIRATVLSKIFGEIL